MAGMTEVADGQVGAPTKLQLIREGTDPTGLLDGETRR
jgi:hypothetical protein